MKPFIHGISLESDHWSQMEADVDIKAPEEACGIVIGEGDLSNMVIPVTNILHSPSQFRMDPQEELDAFYTADQRELEVIAIYHSHPHGLGEPSLTDRDELSFPGIIYLIWYRENLAWKCRGFLMKSKFEVSEIPVRIKPVSK